MGIFRVNLQFCGLVMLASLVLLHVANPLHAQAPPVIPALTPLRAELYHDGWIDLNKNGRRDVYEDPAQPVDQRVEDLLSQMSLEEKTCQLATLYGYKRGPLDDPLPTPEWKNKVWKDGIANIDEMHNGVLYNSQKDPWIWPAHNVPLALNEVQRWFIEETRLGVPVDFTNEGIRGVNAYRSTNFPAQIALGATWDRDLVSRVGHVTGREGRALGYTNVYAPIMDLARDPRWGRVVESYGEDPYLVAELGIRMATAMQQEGVASTAKHFAVYSEPKGGRDGRDRVDPHVTDREMEMLHLWPWERLVKEAHIMGAMSSYNDYDGVPISGSHEFLIDRLRTRYGFRGYVVSDSGAVENLFDKHHVAASADDACSMYLVEGGNVRTQFNSPQKFIDPVRRYVQEGKLPMSVIDDRVRDVLRVKFTLGLFDHPYVADPAAADTLMHNQDARDVALRAARESVVLLKNAHGTLPLAKNLKRILVTGPTAKEKRTSQDRYGSSGGEIVTVLEGITAAAQAHGTEVVYEPGATATGPNWPGSELFPDPPAGKDAAMIAQAVERARDVDAVVVALGDSNDTIGEGKSRTSLDLPGFQTDLVEALVATGKPVVAVLLSGRPATINRVDRDAAAVLSLWFPGEAGGTALADVLFGDYTPGGKLSVTFPRTVGQIPFNFPFKPASQMEQGNRPKNAPNGWGNSLAEGALYPFGYGLSYTTFEYGDLQVSPATLHDDETVAVSCTVKNTGMVAGDEVAQLYVRQVTSSVTTYELNLRGFERVSLQPGESKTVTFQMPVSQMWLINRRGERVVEPGEFKIMVGAGSTDLRLKGSFEVVAK